MRSLLDANVIIALLDQDHMFHTAAHEWIAADQTGGWASCPLTENAFVRIMSNPGYSAVRRFSVSDRLEQLSEFIDRTEHEFWPDDISLIDASLFEPSHILRSKQLTDVYLLALAVKNRGRLVTFDARITIKAVTGATKDNLYVL